MQLSPLLALCARATAHPTQAALLREHAHVFQDWETLPAQAEAHGVVPLVLTHLQAAGIRLPPEVKQQLLGFYMQHAHAARVRTQVLSDILTCFQARGIDLLVLKGAALAYLVYPQPLLRPMRDLDILVRAEDVYRAYALLPEIGFSPPLGAHYGLDPDHHHLTAIKRVADSFSVSLEVHHALHLNERGHPLRFDAYAPTAQSFRVGDVSASTLGCEDTLWHIYRHAFCMPLTYEPLRLIWAADLISLVEVWVDVLDWERVRRQYPVSSDALFFTPYSLTGESALPHLPCLDTLLTHRLYSGDAYIYSKHNCRASIAGSTSARRDRAGRSDRARGCSAHGDTIISHRCLPPLFDRIRSYSQLLPSTAARPAY